MFNYMLLSKLNLNVKGNTEYAATWSTWPQLAYVVAGWSYWVTLCLQVRRYELMMLIYYQDKLSGGVFIAAAFILLFFFTHNKPTITATITTSRSRRVTSTPAATEASVFVGTAEQIVYIYHMQPCNKEILLHKPNLNLMYLL